MGSQTITVVLRAVSLGSTDRHVSVRVRLCSLYQSDPPRSSKRSPNRSILANLSPGRRSRDSSALTTEPVRRTSAPEIGGLPCRIRPTGEGWHDCWPF
ncbi:hypothetical protein D8S78_03690 [Natrialba swarupiae]|nr:hypothetical protein [Natrialba swarupiae]